MHKRVHRLAAVQGLLAAARRGVWGVVLLSFLIGLGGPASPAQAEGLWTYHIDVTNPKLIVCTNQTVTYRVHIYSTSPPDPNGESITDMETIRPGTTVTGDVSDATLGEFINRGGFSPLPGPGSTAPTTAEFVFKAKNKLGSTTLTFGASSDSFEARPFTISVKVVHCKYKVLVVSRFAATYVGGSIKIVAASNAGELAVDEDGGYSGTSNVAWIATAVIGGCSYTNLLAVSKIHMRGAVNETGQLAVKLTYDKTSYIETIPCIPGTGGERGVAYATPLDVTVPLAGGVVILPQEAQGGAGAQGTATVYVLPPDGN